MRKMLTQFSKGRIRILCLILVLFLSPGLFNSGTILAKSMSQQEKQQITGTVVDANGAGLPGVTVLVKGTSSGAITDMDGKFSLSASSTDVLVFKFVGYLTEEITVGTSTTIDVKMVEDIIGLDEVVVTGYGVQKKSDLTGAVASVSSEKLTEMPVNRVDQALQGRAAGVSITQNSGMPGGEVQIQIRGIGSLSGTQPLVIVDGVIGSLSGLNPNDIESIEVLKDASSAAIYGAAGGNGVILVTTKKGKDGKIQTNFNYYRGWGRPWKKMDMYSAEDYVKQRNYFIALNNEETKKTPPAALFSERIDTFQNYNYQDIMYRDPAVSQNFDLSISGGSEKASFFVSANYTTQEGIMKKSDFDRFGFRINTDYKLSKYIKMGENVQFTRTKNIGYQESQFQGEYGSPTLFVLMMYPYIAPYDNKGDWVPIPSGSNPVVSVDMLDDTRTVYSTGGNAFIDITPIKGLVITGRINGYSNLGIRDQFTPEYTYSRSQGSQYSDLQKRIVHEYEYMSQIYANYNTTIADAYNVGLMIGHEAERIINKDVDIEGKYLSKEIPEYRYFSAVTADSNTNVTGGRWEDTKEGIFGRINLDYKGKYLVTVNMRRDKSSRYGSNYREGFFPAYSLGWKFSEEPFIQDLNIISFGKLRFGYGENGANAPERDAYLALVRSDLQSSRYVFGPSNTSSPGAILQRLENSEMHWESMKMSNIGIDLSFLNNRINLTVDFFRKENNGMLWIKALPATSGAYTYAEHVGANVFGETDTYPLVNIGAVRNEGVEISLGFKKAEGEVKANFDFNCTFLRNKVINIQGDSIYTGRVGVNLNNFILNAEGSPISQFVGYQTEGIFHKNQAAINKRGQVYIWDQPYTLRPNGDTLYAQPNAKPGDLVYRDISGPAGIPDGVIDSYDRVNIGSPVPKFVFGFSTNISYRIFDFTMFWEGKFGHKIFNGSKFYLEYAPDNTNRKKSALDAYREKVVSADPSLVLDENTGSDKPRINSQNYSTVSDFYIESGNYVRLKNIQLGITVPQKYSQYFGIDKIRVYGGATNLLTFTKYTGFDPEIGRADNDLKQLGVDAAGNYPQSRTYTFGVNIQF